MRRLCFCCWSPTLHPYDYLPFIIPGEEINTRYQQDYQQALSGILA
jgi:hypothetical protein